MLTLITALAMALTLMFAAFRIAKLESESPLPGGPNLNEDQHFCE